MKKKFLLEINHLENLDTIVLSGFGHVGLDYIGNLFDNNNQILRIPPLSFFRKATFLKKFLKIDLNKIDNHKQILKIVYSKILYKGNLKSYNFFKNNYQKKKFKTYFYQFFKISKEREKLKKILLAIHYGISKLNGINILNKKYIFLQEDRANHCYNYLKKKAKFIFVIRDPRATFSGSYKSQRLHKLHKTYGFDRVLGNWLTAYEFVKSLKKKDLFILQNEKFQGKINLQRELNKLCKWLNVSYSKNLEKPTHFGAIVYGESSYLGKYEQKKKLPKNYYDLKNIKKRWKKNLKKEEIVDIEMMLHGSMKKYKYKPENNITIKKLLKSYIRIMFNYKENKSFPKNVYYTLKNIIRRNLILINANWATKIIDLD